MNIIVFDDDPTGSQTVYDCPLVLRWDKDSISRAIGKSCLLFILGNTRSLTPDMAEERTREICRSFLLAIKEKELSVEDFFIVSRGDSTLRGHGTLEPRVINEELGPFDATLHIPAFFEGGRTTIYGTHFLNGIPVDKTIFAEDRIFGYSTSFLPSWIEEKSKGKIKESDVVLITLDQLNDAKKSENSMNNLIGLLSSLASNKTVIVDAKVASDLDVLCKAVKILKKQKRFLFRSAASFINSLSNINTDSNKLKDFSYLRVGSEDSQSKPGLVLVGSHIPIADQQLDILLKHEECLGIELPVKRISEILDNCNTASSPSLSELENYFIRRLIESLDQNKTAVIYTSRGELYFSSDLSRMIFGIALAEFMARLTSRVINRLGYIISKGGITTNILLKTGLNAEFVILKGQIMPGLSLVCTPEDLLGFSLPVITFPGNLGDKYSLINAWEIMESNLK